MRTFLFVLISFLSASLFAQRTETVKKTIIYHASSHQTVDQARVLAVEEAKAMAIDSVFGANVASRSSQVVHLGDGKELNNFTHISSTDVRGRWVKDLAEPKFGRIWYEDNMLNVEVTVRGKVREIKKAPIQCDIKVLCDGTDEDNVRTDFRNGNNIYLKFTSPVDGYLVVYLVDDKHDAFCALPYYNQNAGAYHIKRNHEYTFFSEELAEPEDRQYAESYLLDTEKEAETNILYVVFSPNEFAKPIDKSLDSNRPRQLTWSDFQSWLSKCMNHDDDMIEIPIMVEIRN